MLDKQSGVCHQFFFNNDFPNLEVDKNTRGYACQLVLSNFVSGKILYKHVS